MGDMEERDRVTGAAMFIGLVIGVLAGGLASWAFFAPTKEQRALMDHRTFVAELDAREEDRKRLPKLVKDPQPVVAQLVPIVPIYSSSYQPASTESVATCLDARMVRIVNPKGEPVAVLDASGLRFYDPTLGINKEKACYADQSICLRNPDSKTSEPAVFLRADGKLGGTISLFDRDGNHKLEVGKKP